ncbi:TetR/AcrR family transcriptional regulator [Sphingomonas psychrolutea]|uniref:TetR family transcriptional regulator n=1 Tax=Sphingomonas psychrolutea TaxID=1259676 RepID=A0ABQ1G6B4_9SPHN|nr:TetR/AcrR family transcriptional regulator [Sphingomonas psychrolutea]GGA37555.1 TetR family transcriptional regulator [Sphingomonas psychrolutea]
MALVTGRAVKATSGSRRMGTGSKLKRKAGNQAGRPTAVELEKRKVRVITVATELFVGHGFAATSLVDIAREAGVATRTLYEHFGDKEAIFREVIFARDAEAMVDPPTLQPDDTLFSALRRAGHYSYEVTYRDRSIGLMRLMIAESKRFPDFMKSVGTSIFARFRRDFEKLFQSMEAAELIPAGDHARSAVLFADLMLGSHPIMIYTNWNAEPPTDADVDERVNLFILGRFGAAVAKRAETRKAKIKAT